MKLLYVLCFSERTQKRMMMDENIKLICRVLEKSVEKRWVNMVSLSLRLISFFSKHPVFQVHLVTMANLRTILGALKGASALDRKFILSILLDIVPNVQTHHIVRNLSWSQGIEALLNSSFAAEPMAVSKIF